ncbi:adenosylhomocysteinase [Coprothermobacteraceae bacterium]|nr:adenosylhomocysteinase [Coprothermobacteraceae bacterium]
MSVVKHPEQADEGLQKIQWVEKFMPVCRSLETQYSGAKPFQGLTVGMCIHLEAKTARLALLLMRTGANVVITGSNPLSTKDDVAAALARQGAEVFAWYGETPEEYEQNLERVLSFAPDLLLDDGFDLTTMLIEKYAPLAGKLAGVTEETTTGVLRARNMAKAGLLPFPVVAVNDARVKRLFDNRYGTGESTLASFMNTTNLVVAGKVFVVCGYGYVGSGVAKALRALGGRVVVTEVDPIRALEAHADGFEVANMDVACELGEVFVTATGNAGVIRKEHFLKMRDGAILGNAGHFNVEIDVEALESLAVSKREARPSITAYKLSNGKELFLIAEGRLMNLASGLGHPAEIMDLSFATQFLSLLYLKENRGKIEAGVVIPPPEVEEQVARTKLAASGIRIDELTEEQRAYLGRW